MKTNYLRPQTLVLGLLTLATTLHAQHYQPGREALTDATITTPGFYAGDEDTFYFSDNYRGYNEPFNPAYLIGPLYTDIRQFDYVQAPRFLWVSPWKLLGANLGASARIPIEYSETKYNLRATEMAPGPGGIGMLPEPIYVPYTDRQFGLADIEVQPLRLSWQFALMNITAGYSFWAPSGDYRPDHLYLGNLGQGYWTHMLTLGLTWHPDSEKTWAFSLLGHYEINTAERSIVTRAPPSSANPTGIISGDTTLSNLATLEWAIDKTVIPHLDLGLTGYYQQQITSTSGPTANGPTWFGGKIQVIGLGPEINAAIPAWNLTAALRYAYEITATDHFQGNLISFALTKAF